MQQSSHRNTWRQFALLCIGLISTVWLAGCSNLHPRPDVDWQHGARRAVVVSVYPAQAEAASLPPCLAALPASDYAAHQYVKLHYHHVRLLHSGVAALPAGMVAAIGTEVEIAPADCNAGKLAQIKRVLARDSGVSE